MSLFDAAAPNPAGYRDASPQSVTLPDPDVVFIDVREPHEFTGELGHIAGATLVPMGVVPVKANEWDLQKTYLLICRSGGRSGQVAQALTRAGFARVMNLAGGMLAWNAQGRPVER